MILECGEHQHPNIAMGTTTDTQTVVQDDEEVLITIDCFEGCTLTQGYWKTHSSYGPAPEDEGPAWPAVGGPDADFYLSGDSWLDVFWTPPKGHAYYQLAHQWMAAVLNVENGASTPTEVSDAIDDGLALFEVYAPGDFLTFGVNKKGKPTGKKEILMPDELAEMKVLAGILGSYNEGDIGPGHCDEDEFSDVD